MDLWEKKEYTTLWHQTHPECTETHSVKQLSQVVFQFWGGTNERLGRSQGHDLCKYSIKADLNAVSQIIETKILIIRRRRRREEESQAMMLKLWK